MVARIDVGVGRGHRMADADPGGRPVSNSEVDISKVSELPADASHLLAEDDVVSPGWGSIRITLCGELVRVGAAGVTPVEHCPGCKCVPRYCPECVREVCQCAES